jgi:bifunctional UDP-N-acetylglucosamine pyrophosphorylase/glucosamine-1-phosphate N-acetyltransferase
MVRDAFAGEALRFVEQTEQLGTGHALVTALPALSEAGCGRVLAINGDMPLISGELAADFLRRAEGADMAFATLRLADPSDYGRVVRRNGRVAAIVEAKEYDPSVHGPASGEVNAGLYLFRTDLARELAPGLSRSEKSGEYYITDFVEAALRAGYETLGLECGDAPELMGVNTAEELARSEECLRGRIVRGLLRSGVVIHAPESVRVGLRARVAPGAELEGPCGIYGASRVERGASVESHCILRDAVLEAGARLRAFSHVEGARLEAGSSAGPFARLRPGAVLEENARAGNFVEMKQARLCRGAKANHLSYLGDAEVGENANVGAGTITCNYDGERKHRTVIGARAFIGSNAALVAPVRVGGDSLVGAGSVITRDVPDGDMAVARGRQRNMPRRKTAERRKPPA